MDLTHSELVGRAAECERISRALACIRERKAVSLVVCGPPGVGKSRLLEWAVAQSGDCAVLRATCTLNEMHQPFALLDALLRQSQPIPETVGHPDRAAQFPRTARPGEAVDRFKVAMAVFESLSALAERQPVVVAIDDAQWADQSSLDALLLARTRLENDAVAMVFARRQGEPCALDRADLPSLDVEGLTPSGACELLAGKVEPAVARQLAQRTDGNPLALLELAENLDEEQRAGRAPLSAWLLRTPTVGAGFLHRVDTLPPGARRVLEVASVDSAIEPAVLRALTDAGDDDTAAVDLLVAGGFIRSNENQLVEFTHPLLRTAVYQAMDPRARRETHRRLASMLRRESDVSRRAWHLAGASDGPDDAAASELELAGEYSRSRGAYAVAAEAFGRSAELTAAARERARRLLAAGDAYWLAGHIEQSAHVLDRALAAAADQRQRADVLLKRMTTQRSRSFSDVFDELTAEADATASVDGDRAAMLYAQAVFPGLASMRYQSAQSSAARALDLLDADSPMRPVARLLHALVSSLMGGHREAMLVFRGFVEMFDAVGPGPQFAGLAEYTALALFAGDDFAAAMRLAEGMIEYARRESALGLLAPPLTVRADLRRRSGSWRGALADATEALAIVRETEQFVETGVTLTVLGRIQAGIGRFDEARALLTEALSLADECDCESSRYMGWSAFGFVELSASNLESAHSHLAACRDVAKRSGDRDPSLWPWSIDLVEVAHLRGDHALAREVSGGLDEDAERHGGIQARALAARGRGIISDDEATMRAAFGESIAHLAGTPLSFEQARTRLLFGEALVRYGRQREAETQLASALDTFDRLDAHPWSTRARKHLAPDGPQRAAVFDRLTDRELQVAVTVSTGKTSAEAAAELFLSRRTVDHHLAVAYRKLGVRNRTQLARLVNNPGETGEDLAT